MTWRQIVERLEWRYDIIGCKEGLMCPVCYQFKSREFPKRTPKYIRERYGHTSNCWLGNAIKEKKK
jgi:hypothetical protein